ncbi:MFS transporter [Aestuariicella hydrocarbonica]|uniref:MFS transporter n=1 Tax=Pseudomaricurvus hydrocarbonicus TaxID=1470433 RepID=A0A9E5MLQ2_9GAMM|nr:MFS transporter [Aestuariicella hydrocarbonica]NHO65168.1 MFS transporter [Aestuariicella hydrocarbonica]
MSDPLPHTTGSIFRKPNVMPYFLAICMSTLAGWIARFLLGWLAWDLTHSAMWVGVTSALLLAPAFVLSPFFGVMADRINPRNGLVMTLLGQMAVGGLAVCALVTGGFSLVWLLGLAVLFGTISAANTPLRFSLVPQLVARDDLHKVIATTAVIFNTSRIVGPALGGTLIVHASVMMAFVLVSILFLGAVLSMSRLTRLRPQRRAEGSGVLTQLGEGLRFTLSHMDIRMVLMLTLVNALLGRTVLEMLPALSGKLLDGQATTLAMLTMSAGIGSILSGLLLARVKGGEHTMLRLLFFSLMSAAVVLSGFYWARSLVPVMAVIFYLSLATTMSGTCSQAILQLLVADEFRGRVMSLWAVFSMGAPALGSLLMGLVVEWVGFVPGLLGFAGMALLMTLGLWRVKRQQTQAALL